MNKNGFGKAQKRARNLKKKKQERDFMSKIKNMDNNKSYTLCDNGERMYGGRFFNAKFWKVMYDVPV